MCFFIAGVQPKTVTMDDQPRMCPSCGLYQAHLSRLDHYFSVFFIPILRVKKGLPVIKCRRCGNLSPESGGENFRTQAQAGTEYCSGCGNIVKSEFHFCPNCGRAL